MMLRRTIFAAVALAVGLGAGGLGKPTTAAAKEWQEVRIGTEGAYAPFNYVKPDGTLAGFEIDLAMALCEQMKVKCTLVQQDWDGMIPALLARKYDAIMASMAITDERRQRIDFSSKYYNTPVRIAAKKGSAIDGSAASLNGKKLGVQRETIFDRYASAELEPKGVEVVRYGTADEANLDLVAGRLDARMDDSVALNEGLLKKPEGADFAFVGPVYDDPKWFGYGVGVGMRKGSDDLKKMFDDAIAAVRADGTYKKIESKYFDFDVYGK